MKRNRTKYLYLANSLTDYIDHLIEPDNIGKANSAELFRVISYGIWKKVFFN